MLNLIVALAVLQLVVDGTDVKHSGSKRPIKVTAAGALLDQDITETVPPQLDTDPSLLATEVPGNEHLAEVPDISSTSEPIQFRNQDHENLEACRLSDLKKTDGVSNQTESITNSGETLAVLCEEGYNKRKRNPPLCHNGTWRYESISPCRKEEKKEKKFKTLTSISTSSNQEETGAKVQEGAGNITCDRPPPVEGALVPRLPEGKYAIGKVVIYNCDYGYVSQGSTRFQSECQYDEESGEGKWSDPNVVCIPRPCGDPGYVMNAHRKGSVFAFPEKVEFVCEVGYKIKGSGVRYCQASGQWSGRLPSCELIYCDEPRSPEDGKVTYISLEYGSELRYECNKGFILSSNQLRYCTEHGTWSDDDPVCIEVTCVPPQPPEHGFQQLPESFRVGSLVFYSCEEGKILVGASTSKCLQEGEWTFPPPKCVDTCEVPFVENGKIGRYEITIKWNRERKNFVELQEGKEVHPGEKVVLSCYRGFFTEGVPEASEYEVSCEDGTWSASLKCKSASCDGDPPPMENGTPVVSKRTHGHIIYYTCDPHYEKNKTGHVECYYGTWRGYTPTCIDGRCYLDRLDLPGLRKPLNKILFSHNEHFTVNCEEGYAKTGEKRKIYCKMGQWEINYNPCVKVNVPPSSLPTAEYLNSHTEKRPQNTPAPQTVDTTASGEQDVCSCTYNYLNQNILVTVNGEELKLGSKVKKGYTAVIKCRNDRSILKWQNGMRASGSAYLTCDACRTWNLEVIPSCVQPLSGDTWFIFHRRMKLLPGGIVELQQAEDLRIQCSTLYSDKFSLYYPQWNVPSWEGFELHNYATVSNRGQEMRTSLKILKFKSELNGRYKCYAKDKHDHRYADTIMELNIAAEIPSTSAAPTILSSPFVPSTKFSRTTSLPKQSLPVSSRDEFKESQKQRDCGCTYNARIANIAIYVNGEELTFGSKVKKGHTALIRCRDERNILQWRNGMRVLGLVNVTCNTCQPWNTDDIPYCTVYELGDTWTVYSPQMKVLPGGIVQVRQGEDIRVKCSTIHSATRLMHYPEWRSSPPKAVHFFQSHTNLEEAATELSTFLHFKDFKEELTGRYECFASDYSGYSSRRTYLNLKIETEPENRCPEIDEKGIFKILYKNEGDSNYALYSCREPEKKILGSTVRQCQNNGEWSGVNPECIDITCPEFLVYGSLTVSYSEDNKVGSTARFHCKEPKVLEGSSSAICLQNGTWDSVKPFCYVPPIQCPVIDEKGIFIVSYNNNRRVNSYARYACRKHEHNILGSNSRRCLENGEWSGEEPECVAPECSIHDLMDSLTKVEPYEEDVTGESFTPGSVIRLLCKDNLVLIGNNKAICSEEGRWVLDNMQCKSGCVLDTSNTSSNLKIEPMKDFYSLGESVSLSCLEGYELSNDVVRLMCMGKSWSSDPPGCVKQLETVQDQVIES